jgi:hypothetical protein
VLKNPIVKIICSLPFVLILLMSVVAASGQDSNQKGEFDSEIAESVFRYQITQCAENMSVTVFLLSVRGADPSDEFMKRFADESVSVKKRSALATSERTHEFIDKESGKFVALLSLDKLKFLEENRAQVEGGCGYADFAARGYRYDLVREKNRWIVKRANPTWFL